jgi:nitroimidazol reductase NimA-like FMN-containing flavoprotein (pyridoxamine 5'-phosphate oxidase superfamily)
MPGGYLEPKPLAWSWAEVRLETARNYWISSVSDNGAPHARPVWAVWLDGGLYFSSGSRIRTHLERRPEVSINLESGDECVILEGRATVLRDAALTQRVAAAYKAKYHWDMPTTPGGFLELKPRRAFGWIVDGSGHDGGALFSGTATRWSFEP